LLAVCLAAPLPGAAEPADARRLDEVAERGRQVMPFDLAKTTHVFTKTEDGGRQQVVVKDAADSGQIRLIREHLSALAGAFAEGDFSGPATIHGADMPGLKALQEAGGRIRYRYRDIADGGELDYLTEDKDLVRAVHAYFDAQLRDHARHAMPGQEQHHRVMHGQ
jgi:hypothetical protein